MKIQDWVAPKEQTCQLGKNHWNVQRLIDLSKDFKVLTIPLDHLNVYCPYKNISLREMVMHMKVVQASDLKFPIILDEDGELMDGRHRIMKALLEGKKSILAVRFDTNPEPDKHDLD